MSLPNNPLMTRLFDQPIDVNLSREYKSMSALFMEAHIKRLASLIDKLADHNADSIDTLFMSALKNLGSKKDAARSATTVYAWHGLLNPYKEDNEFYIDYDRLFRIMRTDAESLHTHAVYITGELDAKIWHDIKALDPTMAADYFKYCGMFTYQNLFNPEVTKHAEFVEDKGQTSNSPRATSDTGE